MAIVPKKYFVVEAEYWPQELKWLQNIKAYDTIQDAEIQYHMRAGDLMNSKDYQKVLLYVISSDGSKLHDDVFDTKYVEPEEA